jgi:hypothetical protein
MVLNIWRDKKNDVDANEFRFSVKNVLSIFSVLFTVHENTWV